MELPLENPSFPAGGTATAYQCFPGLSSWKEFTAQGTVVVQRRDKPSPAVLTSHSCYQRIRGLWSPFIAAHQGLLGIPLPVESIGGAFPARCWDAAFPAANPWKAPPQNLDELEVCIFPKVLTEQVLSPLFRPHPGESQNLSCCTSNPFSAGEISRVSSCCRSLGGFFFICPKNTAGTQMSA